MYIFVRATLCVRHEANVTSMSASGRQMLLEGIHDIAPRTEKKPVNNRFRTWNQLCDEGNMWYVVTHIAVTQEYKSI